MKYFIFTVTVHDLTSDTNSNNNSTEHPTQRKNEHGTETYTKDIRMMTMMTMTLNYLFGYF